MIWNNIFYFYFLHSRTLKKYKKKKKKIARIFFDRSCFFPPSTISYKMVDVLVSDREVKEGRGQVDMWSLRWRPTLTSTFYGTLSRKVRRRHFIESRISTKSPGKRQFWPGSNIYFMRSLTSPCSRRLPLKNTIPYVGQRR